MNPLLTIPYLLTDVAGAVALTLASMALTAPSPSLATSIALNSASAVVTAPDANPGRVMAIDTASLVIQAPSPSVFADVGDYYLVLDYVTVALEALDPLTFQPMVVQPTPALVNLTAGDPDVLYGYVTSSTKPGFNAAPSESTSDHEHRRQTANVLNRLMQGKGNTTGTLTLLPNVEKTYLRDDRLAPGSVIAFDPMTASAATELLVNGTMYVLAADRQPRQWIITHASDAATDRTFAYTVFG